MFLHPSQEGSLVHNPSSVIKWCMLYHSMYILGVSVDLFPIFVKIVIT